MRFKKIYIEITNRCNFQCSFCFKSIRRKTYISPEVFSAILFSIKPYTRYLYLHVLGEPLLHPELSTLLKMADDQRFFVNLTTNGALIPRCREMLMNSKVRQFNISLHDAEENVAEERWADYWHSVIDFAKERASDSYFSLRLWNEGAGAERYNKLCIQYLEDAFGCKIDTTAGRNIRLAEHVFLQTSARFTWPGERHIGEGHRTCYALKDHVAILVDGTVVPCCLDADASIPLGNVLEEDFGDIVNNPRALLMLEGFREHIARESLCKDCGFVLP